FPDAREQVLRGHAGGSAPILRHRQSEIDGGGARLAADLRSAIERLLEQDPAARELAALHPEHAQVDGGGERLVRLAELLVAVATFLIERVRFIPVAIEQMGVRDSEERIRDPLARLQLAV